MASQAPNQHAGTLRNNWHDWLYSQALLREAEVLVVEESARWFPRACISFP
jgi:hypothetical protein